MQKTQQTGTKLLIIAITTAAIIAAVTTISISAATPAFAKENCNVGGTICSGGSSFKTDEQTGQVGGHGDRTVITEEGFTSSGGIGANDGTFVGGGGFHQNCVSTTICQQNVGGSGVHEKGPGGNSGQ